MSMRRQLISMEKLAESATDLHLDLEEKETHSIVYRTP